MYLPSSSSGAGSNIEGMCDIIACRHDDGTISSSPFIVKFINIQASKPVLLSVNGQKTAVSMKVNERNEGYFEVEESDLTAESRQTILTGQGLAGAGLDC